MLAASVRRTASPPSAGIAVGALGRVGEAAVVAAAAILLGASALAGGGADDGSIPWVGGGALAVAAVLGGLALAGRTPWPSPGTLGLATLVLFALSVAWTGLTMAWSWSPDLTWSYLNRGIAYLALLLAGLLAAPLVRRAPTVLASGLTLTVAAAACWALAGKVEPRLFEDGARIARLREPVGYWNALALLLAFGIPLCLWLATPRERRAGLRAAGVALLFLLVTAVLMTYSRGGLLAAVVAVVLWLAVVPRRLEALVALGLAVPTGALVARWAISQPGIGADEQELAVREADGRTLGIVLAVGVGAVFCLAFGLALLERQRPLSASLRRRLTRAAVALAVLAPVVVFLAVLVGQDDPGGWLEDKLRDVTSPQLVQNDPSRLLETGLNSRWDWWEEAGAAFLDQPVAGTGAGSFPVVHRVLRENPVITLEPHSLPLQLLAEMGLVGFFLVGGAAICALLACIRVMRRLDAREGLAAFVVLVALVTYPIHGLLDFDWDFLAVTGPALLALGWLLGSAGPGPRTAPQPALAALMVAGLVVALVSLSLPPLSARAASQSAAWVDVAAQTTDPADRALANEEAVTSARHAASLNPWSIEARWALGQAETAAGRPDLARTAYVQAADAEPWNPAVYRQWGTFELYEGRPAAALAIGETGLALDPYDQWLRDLNIQARKDLGLPISPDLLEPVPPP